MPALGEFLCIGLGPGDPGWVTREAAQALLGAGLAFAPRGREGSEGLALGTMLAALGPGRAPEVRGLDLPMTRDPAALEAAWGRAAEAVLEVLRSGKACAFVTLGDAAFYSTGLRLLSELRRREPALKARILPGLASFGAAAARLGLGLAEGGERVAVLPCEGPLDELRPELGRFDCVILLKVGRRFAELRGLLREMGLLPFSHLAVRLGCPDELLSSDLEAVDPAQVGYLSLVIVRKPPRGAGHPPVKGEPCA